MRKPLAWSGTSEFAGVLDIGTSKIVCLIGQRINGRPEAGGEPGAGLRIIGVGHQKSAGISAGVIVDLDDAERSVRATIAQAERMAGVTLDSILVSVAAGRLRSHNFKASAGIEGGRVTAQDVGRLLTGSRAFIERDGRKLVHLNRKSVQLDGTPSEGSPVGLAAAHVSADMHGVSADEAPLRNLQTVLERCHADLAGFQVAPFASALAVTSEAERQLGLTVVDIGCGTTKSAVFEGGHLTSVRFVGYGGREITKGIARALHTPLIEAERIKALYGNLLSARSDDREEFPYTLAGSDEGLMQLASRAQLVSVIRPIVKDLFLAIADGPEQTGNGAAGNSPLVLTGGGCLLPGIAEFAGQLLQRPVRIGQAAVISGLPPIARTPPFATATGLLFASEAGDDGKAIRFVADEAEGGGYLHRVGAWLKGGF